MQSSLPSKVSAEPELRVVCLHLALEISACNLQPQRCAGEKPSKEKNTVLNIKMGPQR
jgi:hypothetical protein